MSGPEPSQAPPVPYQSLYRRFRPQRFSEVLGQEFVSLALRNAVREDRVGHAYLFSGPRGTGKTSTARILAKALNCADLQDGEPCGVCVSCTEIAAGSSLDVHELDAASNNGVEAMRDLVARAALGTPGRWKIYIVDEVHMLSAAASNALLKTLEEPPGHVVFVLATTDPQKVLPTIRSRTQHFEFRLLTPEVLNGLLETVSSAAAMELPEDALEAAIRRGRGSARDALSALDQIASAGMVEPDSDFVARLADALAQRDSQAALVALASAVAAGREPLLIAGELADHLRQGFLSVVAPDLVSVHEGDKKVVEELASVMGLAALVRAIEALGTVQVEMRESPDPRLHVEVCLLRLTRPEVDESTAGLLERLERLEHTVAGLSIPGGRSSPSPTGSPASGAASGSLDRESTGSVPAARSEGPAAEARRSLGALRKEAAAKRGSGSQPAETGPATAAPVEAVEPPGPGMATVSERPDESTATAAPAPVSVPTRGGPEEDRDEVAPDWSGGRFPTRDELVQAWGDGLLASLPQRARARFRMGRFTEAADGVAVFALPNEAHRGYCEEVTRDVVVALSEHFGVGVKLQLVVDPDEGEATAPAPRRTRASTGGSARGSARGETPLETSEPVVAELPEEDEADLLDPEYLAATTEPAGDALSAAERLKLTFPGAEEV